VRKLATSGGSSVVGSPLSTPWPGVASLAVPARTRRSRFRTHNMMASAALCHTGCGAVSGEGKSHWGESCPGSSTSRKQRTDKVPLSSAPVTLFHRFCGVPAGRRRSDTTDSASVDADCSYEAGDCLLRAVAVARCRTTLLKAFVINATVGGCKCPPSIGLGCHTQTPEILAIQPQDLAETAEITKQNMINW
jgi:hypothetical protein